MGTNRHSSHTKAGPGRLHRQGVGDGGRIAGAYGRGLLNAWNRKRQQRMSKLHPLRDEHGAFTLTGRPYALDGVKAGPHEHELAGSTDAFYVVRRKWLAGISARRGF